ncbi:sulfate ABC transporter substrate-binding protein [Rhizobium sp. AQ_MP]|uniref:sulfate ABC transporter substrate-binding protein n=1 Tax=Rhizobium sp. AQ_MP TaxID=2761536 RepID=UPI00163A80C8|nr:sulfate ABC transporter substrate-binding protein [Rhizobium sp. AQ_MP]MBC2775300.1 sulfate ABC transporter substrate-binding protein [Rhizobium sp. AQ_MP]
MTCMGRNLAAFLVGLSLSTGLVLPASATELLNVSYDPTREFYEEYNAAFARHWQAETGETITIDQSHGGSGRQARAVMEGLRADVVTLALQSDIDTIVERAKLIAPDWRTRLPNNSAPYTSTIVFLVREGNPKGIKDWGDLVKGDVEIVTPNPKTSGGARWNYLAAWAWANREFAGDQQKIRDYVAEIYRRAPVLDAGARASLTTFAQREIGDVLICWENEAHLAGKEFGAGKFEIVTPSLSILAEPPVAVVDANVDRDGVRKQAEAYLAYLYSPEGQQLIAKHFYRPSRPDLVPAGSGPELPKLDLVTIDDPLFGGWTKAQPEHFGEGGVFDQIYRP